MTYLDRKAGILQLAARALEQPRVEAQLARHHLQRDRRFYDGCLVGKRGNPYTTRHDECTWSIWSCESSSILSAAFSRSSCWFSAISAWIRCDCQRAVGGGGGLSARAASSCAGTNEGQSNDGTFLRAGRARTPRKEEGNDRTPSRTAAAPRARRAPPPCADKESSFLAHSCTRGSRFSFLDIIMVL